MQPIDKPVRNQTASLLIAGVYCILSISLFEPLLFWVLLIALCATAIRIVMFTGWYQPMPSTMTINLLALLGCLCLGWFSLQIGLLLSMVNLLVLAGALKLILLNKPRDLFHIFCTTLFIVGIGFTFHQSVVMTVFYSLLTLALLVAIARYFTPSQPLQWHIKRLTIMSFQALPIALILFLILPKLPPLWKMPAPKSTETGLTDTITPGDIANLTRSADLAFRATFIGPMPATKERYWRAITLEQFDGKQWAVSPIRKQARQQYQLLNHEFAPRVSGSWWQYEVITEPTNNQWLFAIDVALPDDHASRAAIWQGADYQLLSESPVTTRWAYSVRSYPDTPMNQTLVSLDKRLGLQLPANPHINPQTQHFAQQIATSNATTHGKIQAVMQYFVQQGFRYTLTPPLMLNAPVDEFLFTHKEGFCSHYASAMAYTLRLMGIPARIVAGYHGGESLQPNVLSVYQYDAHAWVEAWVEGEGWQRFDPSGVVAPQRIEQGLQHAVEEASFFANNQMARLQQLPIFAELNLLYSLLDYQWSRWVLGFDAQKQQNMLALMLGRVTVKKVMYLMLGLCALVALILALYFVPHWHRNKQPIALKWFLASARKVEQLTGIPRYNMGPQDYARKASDSLSPVTNKRFSAIIDDFVLLQYASDANTKKLQLQFTKRCKKFIKTASSSE